MQKMDVVKIVLLNLPTVILLMFGTDCILFTKVGDLRHSAFT